MHNRPAAKSSMIALIILIIVLFSIGLFISIYPSKGSFFFVHPERLTALLLLPLIFMFFYRRNRTFIKQSRILANPYHSLSVSKSKTWIAQFLKSFVFSMLIISWAYPCLGDKKNTGSRNRKEWVFCLDLSNSMNVRDISGESRLEIAQRLMNALTHHFHEEAVSLCTFAGNAHEEIPLTIDYAAFRALSQNLSTQDLVYQGTDVSAALRQGMQQFSKAPAHKILVLLTDGENENPLNPQSLDPKSFQGIQTLIVGIGTEEGGVIPLDPANPNKGSKRDSKGFTVHSYLNRSYLVHLGKTMKGTTFLVREPFPKIEPFLTEINLNPPSNFRNLSYKIQNTLYHYFVLAALFALLVWIVGFYKAYPIRMFMLGLLGSCGFYGFGQTWQDSLVLVHQQYQKGALKDALKFYQRHRSEAASYHYFDNEIAQIAYRSGNYQNALFAFNSALTNTPDRKERGRLLHNIGNCYMQLKRFQEAIKTYRKSLRLNPENAATCYNLNQAMRLNRKKSSPNNNELPPDNSGNNHESISIPNLQSEIAPKEIEQKLNELARREAALRRRLQNRFNTSANKKRSNDW